MPTETTAISDEDLLRKAAITMLKEHQYNELYKAQQQAWNDLIEFFARTVLFALVYWSLRPVFQRGSLRRWAETKKRNLNATADEIDGRTARIKQACLDAGILGGFIPRRSLLG